MKKILVLAYLRNNLGDDLFVEQLINRYPNTKFFIRAIEEKYIEPFKNNRNVEFLKVDREDFKDIDMKDYDACIYIGGSIFMEGGKVYNLDEFCLQFVKNCKLKNKPFYYISSNYGPYQTKQYFELSKKVFANCTDLCFRDLYSYGLFKNLKTIRYAPDLVFSYPIGKIEVEKGSIGISLIDLEIRDDIKSKEQEYINFIYQNIARYIKQNKKIYLFSFCRYEGDEKMIYKLKKLLPKEFKNGNILVIQYDGNIKSFLQEYSKMEYMICERFHSVVLSYICKHKFHVISYSEKINNMLKDLKLSSSVINFKQIEENMFLDLNDFEEVNEEKLKYLRENAEKQFRSVDKYLKG